METKDYVQLEERFSAHNYHPLDVVINKAEGVWVYDVDGKKYLDCLSSYSAVNQGHRHPRIIDHPDPPGAGKRVAHHLAIARLENMQRKLGARKEDRPGQREDRDSERLGAHHVNSIADSRRRCAAAQGSSSPPPPASAATALRAAPSFQSGRGR